MVFSLIWTGFYKAIPRLRPDRGGAMAAQALAGLNFRHDFKGRRGGKALIEPRGIAADRGILSVFCGIGVPIEGISAHRAGVQNFAAQIYG
ncbi:hypothetical protein ATY76_01210 [Rhizobium sp. R339]|uniref:hypothetical protein n=1 Tax=Rhizobium sp. R339 TaxID=1764273 RepID=UPI000B52FD4E|nr:hypothetical protein [Rhizobium sp. R339]OWV76602.1 hypothetical protein ATY76_01210 [Rhizobium sp. R339]